jgi:hypothetical protein
MEGGKIESYRKTGTVRKIQNDRKESRDIAEE